MDGLQYDAIVLGAGAAGLMCAIEAGKRDRRVAVLEREDRTGKKILISGGGRCNFTNRAAGAENFLSANPHFCKSALARYRPANFIQLIETHRIPYHEKTLGQLFCDRSARDVMFMLEEECRAARVDIFLGARIQEIRRTTGFVVIAGDAEYHAPALVIATGGLSIPKMGATGFGYEIARQFGHKIVACRPALVPLTFGAADLRAYGDLAGVSMEVDAILGSRRFREKMLVTHRGLSGPAILQISSYWTPPAPVSIDLAPGRELKSQGNEVALKSALRACLPKRFADRWLELYTPARWTDRAMQEVERQLHDWTIVPAGTEGYEKAEVTAGGVDTSELSSKTMESRKVAGLFFIGEVVDVTGHLGGFNFQWAWASGFCAGAAV
ncbi:MAG: NAD(P)/FAD-dependent oxidoreductase [Acidobacteriota bacterium]|nr:NAD(P)/FAD-dependent oxidoreductase [Acidobacteriota bacterium]